MIPKIIHQIFLTGELPSVLQANVDALKRRNPGWEHRLYDAASAQQFIRENFGAGLLSTYLRIDPAYGAARADLLRHLLISHFGGVYLDIKSTIDRSLDEVLRPDDRYLLAQWRNGPDDPNPGWGIHKDLAHIPGGEFIAYFVIAEPNHAFSRAAIARICSNIRDYRPWSAVGRTGVLRTTGPIAYTLAIHPIRGDHAHRVVTEDAIGTKPSIDGGYDHKAVFKSHYSDLTRPVVQLSKVGGVIGRIFVAVRLTKTRIKVRTRTNATT